MAEEQDRIRRSFWVYNLPSTFKSSDLSDFCVRVAPVKTAKVFVKKKANGSSSSTASTQPPQKLWGLVTMVGQKGAKDCLEAIKWVEFLNF